MSRPSSPHTGDLDAVLRDDLSLEQIGRGRRPRGSDNALKLLCAIAEDVEIKVPRRRTRGSRLTRGLLATTVAATVLGVTGVAAAEPGGSSNFALWSPRPGDHIQAADRSLTEAQRSLERGDRDGAAEQLDKADQELRKAGSSTHSTALEERASDLRGQTETKTPRPLPTTNPTWSWSWGIPGGGPGWQPGKPPYRECLLVLCRSQQTPAESSVPQQTPGASSPDSGGIGLGSLFRKTSSTATPTTPGASGPSPSSSKPKSKPATSPAPTQSAPTVLPTTPGSSPSSSSPSSEETSEPRPSSSASASAGG